MKIQRFRNFQGDLFLKRKDILQVTGEIVGPGLKAGGGIDELDVDADLIPSFADAAFQKIPHTQLTSDLGSGFIRAFKSCDRVAGSNIHSLDFREFCRDLVGHAVAEVGAVLLGAEILEWKNGNRRANTAERCGRGGVFSEPQNTRDGKEKGEGNDSGVGEAPASWRGDGGSSGDFGRGGQLQPSTGDPR